MAYIIITILLILFLIALIRIGKHKKTNTIVWDSSVKIIMDYATPELKTEFLKLCEDNKAFEHLEGKYEFIIIPTKATQEIISEITNNIT